MKVTKEAIRFLKKHLKNHTVFVGFSGGKDSIVTLDLVERAGLDHVVYYNNTGIDPPEVVKFIKKHYPQCKIKRARLSFWHFVTTNNPPTFHYRWCCTKIKKAATDKLPYKHRVMGIRAEESNARKAYPRINVFEKKNHIHYYPILDWKEYEVWEYIQTRGLAYPSLYEHFDRLGCVVCPMRRKGQHDKWRALYPGYFKAFEHAVGRWYHKRKAQGRDMAHDSPEEFLEDWYKGKAIWYKKRDKL